jgi:hypothetical protein
LKRPDRADALGWGVTLPAAAALYWCLSFVDRMLDDPGAPARLKTRTSGCTA